MHDRAAAYDLLCEYTKGESLRRHALCVEAAMRHFAARVAPGEVEDWGITGLLHDFDYEMYPDPPDHPMKGNAILQERGWSEAIRTAILGHAPYTGVARESAMAKHLFAVDELCGFVTAVTYVRPSKSVHEVAVGSVKKKLKTRAFAASVNRDEIQQAADELPIELDALIGEVITALQGAATALGLDGEAAG